MAYRVELRRGQVYRLALGSESSSIIKLFVDIFRTSPGAPPQRVAGMGPPSWQLAFEPSEDDTFVVRIQPELLATGHISVAHTRRAALLFPVSGSGRRNIQSLFGAARSRGGREHQGIDIFAVAGRPSSRQLKDGSTRVAGTRSAENVGGCGILRAGTRLYYAHLDRRAVSTGQQVRKGTCRVVGNTGNARTTAPIALRHLSPRGRSD